MHRSPSSSQPPPQPKQTEIKQGTESSANDFTKLNPSRTWPKKIKPKQIEVSNSRVYFTKNIFTQQIPDPPSLTTLLPFAFFFKKKTQAGCNFQYHCLFSV